MFSLSDTTVHQLILPQSVTDTATNGVGLDISDFSEV